MKEKNLVQKKGGKRRYEIFNAKKIKSFKISPTDLNNQSVPLNVESIHCLYPLIHSEINPKSSLGGHKVH